MKSVAFTVGVGSTKVLLQAGTLLSSAAVRYQLRLWAGQASLGFYLLSFTL